MGAFIGRMAVAAAFLAGIMLLAQRLLTRDERPAARQSASDPHVQPTRQITVADVMAAHIPTPTRSKVSLPGFSYKQAFPEATDQPEITIAGYHNAPMLQSPQAVPADWRKFFPDPLPPVAQRLPRNPAVTIGPDGVGQYGGTWRLCTSSPHDLWVKIGYESFVRFDPSGRVQPCLAYKWDVSDRNRVFTFYLRPGHKWSDGEPFTAADVVWVCNTMIGSAYWSSPPDWMQGTDGAMALYDEDVGDWTKLAAVIRRQAESPDPSPGRQIKSLASARLWKAIEMLAAGDARDEVRGQVVDDLNQLFRNRAFYSDEAWRKVDFGGELRQLQARGASRLAGPEMQRMLLLMEQADLLARLRADVTGLDAIELNRLNVLLFRAAYPAMVAKAEQKRVKVDAVPDEAGDASHIVRFTFPRPNAIFLEQTATFMFYTGIFMCPRHATAPLHPAGSDLLNTIDVFDWEGFVRRVRAEGQSAAPSPEKLLWTMLDPAVRERIQATPPAEQSPESYKQEVVDAINRVLRETGFCGAAVWKDFDARTLAAKVAAGQSFSRMTRDQARIDEMADVLVMEDLLKRLRAQGVATLSDAERLKLGLMLFRAAFSADAQHPLIGRAREESLNRAARNHPRKYTSWVTRMRDAMNHHPVYNPHVATLRAWRVVSQKSEPEILAVRNPYYYRVDAAGNQLPYIDAIRNTIARQKQIRLLKLCSGSVDMQTREVQFEDYTVLKQNEANGDYEIRLWANDYCGEVLFYPLQAHQDPAFARLQDDPRFRQAMSLALNRQEIIDVAFMGIGTPAQYSVPQGSPYYNDRHAKAFIEYDPDRANRLLDEMGLGRRSADGTRLLPDGRPLVMDVNTTDEYPLTAVRMACQYWRNVGINAQLKMRTGLMVYRLAEMGLLDIGVHKEGGNFFGPILAADFAPTHPAESVQWSQWASYLRSGGRNGWPPPDRIRELDRMWQRVRTATSEADKMTAWQLLADRTAIELPVLGIMTSPGKVVYVKRNFKNVPRIALAGWIAHEPGNCCPETFYFDRGN